MPKGVYEIELLFTDIFRQNSSAAYLLGRDGAQENHESAFGISVNGSPVEESLSPCKESGYFHALRKKYIVNNEADSLEIRFQAISGKCFLNGIKLRNIY